MVVTCSVESWRFKNNIIESAFLLPHVYFMTLIQQVSLVKLCVLCCHFGNSVFGAFTFELKADFFFIYLLFGVGSEKFMNKWHLIVSYQLRLFEQPQFRQIKKA